MLHLTSNFQFRDSHKINLPENRLIEELRKAKDIIDYKDKEIEKYSKYFKDRQSLNVEKINSKMIKLTQMYNQKSSELSAARNELQAVKLSQSSAAFFNKYKQEVENHEQSKSRISELETQLSNLKSKMSELNKSRLNDISQSMNTKENSNTRNVKGTVKMESIDFSSCSAEVLDFFEGQIKMYFYNVK